MNKKCKASVFLVEDCVEYFKNNYDEAVKTRGVSNLHVYIHLHFNPNQEECVLINNEIQAWFKELDAKKGGVNDGNKNSK